MNNTRQVYYSAKTMNHGFTLIELIVVIIILGILSVTVAPKFFSSQGFSEFAYRTDVIAKLRLIQTKAMQQTNSGYCHRVLINSKKLGAPDDCDESPAFTSAWLTGATAIKVDAGDNITFSSNIAGNSFTFDNMGRPLGDSFPIIITITGEQKVAVQIEAEGYIHAL